MTEQPESVELGAPRAFVEPHLPGTPPGITVEGVELRSRLAAALAREAFPGDPAQLLAVARRNAPQDETVLALLSRLPDRSYERVQDVADELQLGHERRTKEAHDVP